MDKKLMCTPCSTPNEKSAKNLRGKFSRGMIILLVACSQISSLKSATIAYDVHVNIVAFANDDGSEQAQTAAFATTFIEAMNSDGPELGFHHYGINLTLDSFSVIKSTEHNNFATASGTPNSKVWAEGRVKPGALTIWFNAKTYAGEGGASWGQTLYIGASYQDPEYSDNRAVSRHEIGHSLGLDHNNDPTSYMNVDASGATFSNQLVTTMQNSQYTIARPVPEASSMSLVILFSGSLLFRRRR